jgi:hypothetical protein
LGAFLFAFAAPILAVVAGIAFLLMIRFVKRPGESDAKRRGFKVVEKDADDKN